MGSGATAGRFPLLRFTTAGSVDDGKSTLIGRLLLETGSIPEDRLRELREASEADLCDGVDLALLTDGLRSERDQGITVDVAYHYFSTPTRRFILADVPGHEQYTRNMVTGASTADLAILLVDARRGVVTQTRRHAFIASLLGIPKLIVAVNKMDLADYSEAVYDEIVSDFRAFARKLTVNDISFLPVSALRGDNVVTPSERMEWYRGGSLLHALENAGAEGRVNPIDFRFPVQSAIRANGGFRGYAGTVASGSVRSGDEVLVLPAGTPTRIRSIETFGGALDEAFPSDAVVVTVEDDVDISRGDMLVRPGNVPVVSERFDAYLCWMDPDPLDPERTYRLVHNSRELPVAVDRIDYRIDVDTLSREDAAELAMNDVGRARLTAAGPLCFDSYLVNSVTGSFILVDPQSHRTVAGGMIRGEVREPEDRPVSPNVVWEGWNVPRVERERKNGHPAMVVWFTGMSGAGKSTIAREVERHLVEDGIQTVLLDGDILRHGLCGDLGFSPRDRAENLRRVGELAQLLFEHGVVVLCTFVSPSEADRDRVRARFPSGRFLMVHVDAPVEELQRRDPKGLYRRHDQGEISGLSGMDAPYDVPPSPDLRLDTAKLGTDEAVERVMRLLEGTLLGQPEAAGVRSPAR